MEESSADYAVLRVEWDADNYRKQNGAVHPFVANNVLTLPPA